MSRSFLIITLLWLALGPMAATAAETSGLETQRELFRSSWPEAEKGIWALSLDQEELLVDYPLYPDLRGAWLYAQTANLSDDILERFVRQYPELNVTRRLLQRRARVLAAAGQWKSLARLVDDYAGFDLVAANTALRCQILRLQLGTADATRAALFDEALGLWLVGSSQPKECDPVFAWLDAEGALTDARRRQRIELAIDQRQFRLAAWLAKLSGTNEMQRVAAWQRMARDPRDELAGLAQVQTAVDPELLAYGMALTSRADLDQALVAWRSEVRSLAPDQAVALAIERDLALRAARSDHAGAADLLASLSPEIRDDLTTSWQLRLALKAHDWDTLIDTLPGLSASEQAREIWTYWRARAALENGNTARATAELEALSEDRSYYGFLAADLLGRPYQFANQPIVAEEALITRIAQDPRMIRARELFEVGHYSAARSEWNDFVARHDERVLAQVSVLAHRWGWHSRAISAAAKSGLFDALEIRFPQPWPEEFARYAGRAGISLSWAYGIARSESLYMSDVRSSAGAIGLMQLMPATGRQVGRRLGLPVNGWQSLVDPDTNIALGTSYLGEMLTRFSDNPVLATAAYNAGPHRVVTWLPVSETLAAEIWVDTVPFRETRRYLRRVLSSQVIFSWQMQDETRLSTLMPPVAPPLPDGRVAQQQP